MKELKNNEPRLVHWFAEGGKIYRRVWDSVDECYWKTEEISLKDTLKLLTAYETREKERAGK